MKRQIIFITLLLLSAHLVAQTETPLSNGTGRYGVGTTTTQDYQSVGINPANLGMFDKTTNVVTIGIGSISCYVHSDALIGSQILQGFFSNDALTSQQQADAAIAFASKGLNGGAEIQPFAVSVQFPKVGGFAFNWKNKMSSTIQLNPMMADLVFKGINSSYYDSIVMDNMGNQIGILDSALSYSDALNGTKVKFDWYHELDFSYGRKIISTDHIKLYGGATLKYIVGLGIVDVAFENGGASGYSATSPYLKVEYGDVNIQNPVIGHGIKQVGKGMGFDFGTTISIYDKLKIGASILDIGKITWTGNSMTLQDGFMDSLANFSGWNSFDFTDNLGEVFDATGLLSWTTGTDHIVTLPTRIRVGASISPIKKLTVAIDAIQPFNKVPGNLTKTYFAIGADWAFTPGFRVNTGIVGGGETDLDVPFGLSFGVGPIKTYQFGIATGDILSLFKQNKPTLSFAIEFVRLQF